MDTYLSDEQIEGVLREVIDRFLIPKFKDLGLNASGEWIENLEVRGSSIWGRDYTIWLVNGRGPNINQDPLAIRNWAVGFGLNVFSRWVADRGLNINPIAVAYKVAREGYQPKGEDLLEVLNSNEVIEFISREFQDIIRNQILIYVQRDLRILA